MRYLRTILLCTLFLSLAVGMLSAQDTWGISLKGGAAIPVGSFNQHFNTGYGGTATVLYKWSDWFDLFVGSGVTAWKVDNAAINKTLSAEGLAGTVDLDAPFTIIPIVAGFRYSPFGEGLLPYGSLSIGVYVMDLKIRGTYTEGSTTVPLEESSDSFTRLTLSIEAGFLIPIAPSLRLDAGVRLNNIPDYESVVLIGTPSGQNPVRAKNILFVTIGAGLEYSF